MRRPMDPDPARRLVERIFTTEDHEPDFDQAEALMVCFVDATISGADVSAIEPRLQRHLRQAPESADLLEPLLAIAHLEAEGRLPGLDVLWDDLRAATGDVGTRVAPSPSPRAAPAARDADSPTGRLAALVRALAGWVPQPHVLVPTMMAALLVIAGLGWWRAANEARVAESRLASANGQSGGDPGAGAFGGAGAALSLVSAPEAGATMGANGDRLARTISQVEAVQYAQAPGGAWARVAYDPDGDHALVWAGDLPALDDGGEYQCWFQERDGGRQAVVALDEAAGNPSWWHITAEGGIDRYEAFLMTAEPSGEVLVRVALDGR